MMHTVSPSFFVTGLKRSGFNSFISMPFNATSKYPVWILFLRKTHVKACHPRFQVPQVLEIASFHVFHHDHVSTFFQQFFNTSPLCKGPRAHFANLVQQ